MYVNDLPGTGRAANWVRYLSGWGDVLYVSGRAPGPLPVPGGEVVGEAGTARWGGRPARGEARGAGGGAYARRPAAKGGPAGAAAAKRRAEMGGGRRYPADDNSFELAAEIGEKNPARRPGTG